MAKKKKPEETLPLVDIQEMLRTAPCVPALRNAVDAWRAGGYKGVTDTTRELLNFWFATDHIMPTGRTFRYHPAQRESMETLIYVYEVEKVRRRKDLLEKYASTPVERLPSRDEFARYCIKMATGSGKTKVMSLAVCWQYFNAMREDENEYAKTFLVIAPNVIVFDRLKSDFAGGRIFRTDPLFPRHYELFWDMECYMRGDSERASSEGALYLTNIQQFYERPNRASNEEPEAMTAVLGPKPTGLLANVTDFDERIAKREGRLVVLNDEAHHTHDEESEWNNTIYKLHETIPLASQLDFSATPRFSKGALFPWTVFDYPLKQAIVDGIVKRPLKGISKIEEAKSTIASTRYRGFLTAGVERWKEYKEQLEPLGKKPILFVMMNDTKDADDVGRWLQERYPELFAEDKLLIIHTKKNGEVSESDLDDARKLAREVDEAESPVNAIVSVLMLREGWDVQNVTVVVGLRPYSSTANILPEQTIGRGLRLMFGINSGFQERVDIIGNKAFLEFVEDLEKLEDMEIGSFEVGKDKLQILTIQPVEEKKKKTDIGIPELTEILRRKKSLAEEIAMLDVTSFKINPLPLTGKQIEEMKTFNYEGYDIITFELEVKREYAIPPVQSVEEVVGYYARRIAENIKLPSQFAALAPKVKEFFERKAFGKQVELSPEVVPAMSGNLATFVVQKEFEKALRGLIIEQHEPELLNAERLLSTTPPFPFSKKVIEASKTIFNYVAADNEYELAFAKFLQSAEDIDRFAKLPEQFGFCIQYTDTLANIRNYYPDFVAVTKDHTYWVIETKGREDIEVRLKDESAKIWCEKASKLSGNSWNYLKVPQKTFQQLHPDSLSEMVIALSSGDPILRNPNLSRQDDDFLVRD